MGSVPRKLPLFATGRISKHHVLHVGFIPTLTVLASLWCQAAVALEYESRSQQELRGIMGSCLLDPGAEVRSERTKWLRLVPVCSEGGSFASCWPAAKLRQSGVYCPLALPLIVPSPCLYHNRGGLVLS